jgi:hypothetical protein
MQHLRLWGRLAGDQRRELDSRPARQIRHTDGGQVSGFPPVRLRSGQALRGNDKGRRRVGDG